MNGGDRWIRAQAAVVVVAIGMVAAVVSFRHALEVVRSHGETGVSVYLSPLTIDGLVYVASMVMLDSARRGQGAPGLAKWALGLGIGATVAVNVLHGIAHGPVGAVIAAWPAVCLILVAELLMGMIRRGRTAPVAEPTMASLATVEAVAEAVAGHAAVGELDGPGIGDDFDTPNGDDRAGHSDRPGLASAVRSAHAAGWTKTAIGEEFGLTRYKVNRLLDEPPAAELNGHRPAPVADAD